MLYMYVCEDDSCNHEQDEVHGMTEKPTISCDKCGKAMRLHVTGGCGFIRKGSGWTKKG